MIRTIDIKLNAAHPELPLPEATTYQGAPSTAFLRGVPKSCGQWQITAVNVAVTFPDNSTTTRAAVLSAGDVWVVTIPACATSGRTVSGLRILADGIDENGDAVTGFVLGVADLAVATFDIAPAPGETSYALRYFDAVPSVARKGDVAKVDGALKYYDGTAWQPFADIDLSNYATKADATLSERGFSEWTISPSIDNPVSAECLAAFQEMYPSATDGTLTIDDDLAICIGGQQATAGQDLGTDGTTLTFNGFGWADLGGYLGISVGDVVATRTALQGYVLGSQTDKPLASEAEAEALRQDKQDALTFDSTPTTNSLNPVTSGGIKTALDAKATITDLTSTNPAIVPMLSQNALNANLASLAIVAQKLEDSRDNDRTADVIFAQIDGKLDATSAAPAFSTTSTYVVGDRVTYNGRPYRCTTAVTTPGAWDASKWASADLALTADLPYSQTATTGGSSIALSTRSGNRYDLSAVTGTVSVTLPTIETAKCADVVCTIVTGATVPTLSFPSGAVFIAVDSAWQTLAASSYNVFSFTSTGAPNEWIVGRITSALPTEG